MRELFNTHCFERWKIQKKVKMWEFYCKRRKIFNSAVGGTMSI